MDTVTSHDADDLSAAQYAAQRDPAIVHGEYRSAALTVTDIYARASAAGDVFSEGTRDPEAADQYPAARGTDIADDRITECGHGVSASAAG